MPLKRFSLLKLLFLIPGDWQKFVREQVEKVLSAMFSPEPHQVVIRYVRHSPGRRRNDVCMYQVCTATASQSEAVRGRFSQFLRRENPLPRPPELTNVGVYPLVCIILLL